MQQDYWNYVASFYYIK